LYTRAWTPLRTQFTWAFLSSITTPLKSTIYVPAWRNIWPTYHCIREWDPYAAPTSFAVRAC
jgi:hypothetical protein